MASVSMTEKHRQILRQARLFLVNDLDMQILDDLVAELLLTAEDEERINAEKVRHDKVRKLLDYLPRRGDKAYNIFLKLLSKKQDFLYQKIKTLEGQVTASHSEQSSLPCFNGPEEDVTCHYPLGRDHYNTRGIVVEASNDKSFETDHIKLEDNKPTLEDIKPNLEDLMDSFGLPAICLEITGQDEGQRIDPMRTKPRSPNKLVDSNALSTLASNLGQEWEPLAIHMGFTSNRIYQWKENSRYNVWGQVFAFLTAWKNKNGNDATIGRLISNMTSFQGVNIGAYRHLFFN